MKKKFLSLIAMLLAFSFLMAGCGEEDSASAAKEISTKTEAFSSSDKNDTYVDSSSDDYSYEYSSEILSSSDDEPAFGDDDSDVLYIYEDEVYNSKDDVAAYIYFYGHLPENYITKNEAKSKGWQTVSGNLWEVPDCYGLSIGGDRYGNYEGLLPEKIKYYECDIDYEGGKRNAKRLVFSDDGYIYYTEDHYETFEELYGGY